MADAQEEKGVDTGKKQRSAAYPSISLEQAVEYSKMLLDAYRRNAFSREDAIKAMGYTKITGDNAQRIAALGHYGLVERAGSAYKNSVLAESILHFESDDDRTASIVRAAQKPKLFRALINSFNGQALPGRLASILIRSHEINPNVAEKVADNFKKTLEYSGLAKNGIVSSTPIEETGEEDGEEDGMFTPPPASGSPARSGAALRAPLTPPGMHSVSLPSGLIVSYPASMAYLFATGVFAAEIASLEAKAASSTKVPEAPATNNGEDTTAV